MSDAKELRLKLMVMRLGKLSLLQSSALMNLSSAIMRIEGVPEESKAEAYEVFKGIQEQLDLLNEIQKLELGDDI